MPFFDLISRWVESSDFGPKSDDLGRRILESDFIPSDVAKSDCIRPTIIVPENRKQTGFSFIVLKPVSSAVGSDGSFLFTAYTRKNVLFAHSTSPLP